jgi:hypothetical protein
MTVRHHVLSTTPLPDDALLRLMAQNDWTPLLRLDQGGVISWRHYVAAALRDVPIEQAAEKLVGVIQNLEELTNDRLIADFDATANLQPKFGFHDWHKVWREHFDHWQDPIREFITDLAQTPDALDFVRRLPNVSGEIFLDFVLEACLGWAQFQKLGKSAGLEPDRLSEQFPLNIDVYSVERAITVLYSALYNRFRTVAPFQTAATPVDMELGLNFDQLFPPTAVLIEVRPGLEGGRC